MNQIHYFEHNYLADLAAKRARRQAILTTVAATAGAAASSASNAFEKGYRSGQDLLKKPKI